MIEFGPDTNYGLHTWSRPTPPDGGQVDILVAGMRAFTTYHMRAMVEFPDGVTHLDADHTFMTGGLPPEKIPTTTVSRSSGLTPQPGVQLLDLMRAGVKVRALVTDLDGNIIWFYDGVINFPFPIQFLPNGNFLVLDLNISLREIDLAGNTIREITEFEVNQALVAKGMEPVAGRFHPDAIMLPNGHIMVLTEYTKPFTDLVGFEGQTIVVLGNGLVELDENWEPVWAWSAFDHLDVNRHPFLFNPQSRFNWTAGNAVVYSPADRNLLLSLRHQHWVIKIDYEDGFGSGEVLWRLGLDGDFTLVNGGSADWQYAQHLPFIIDNQIGFYRLALFDNGNDRRLDESGTLCGSSSGIPCFSRAVIFEIDEMMRTARIVWQDKLSVFGPFLGSIQVFENGNVLYNVGAVGGGFNAIIREVTQEEIPGTVWQLDLSGQRAYRSVRLPSLYPGVQW
ncbi:MAG: aryl-sulfate sulfotransferase [Candidatus Binatia bacterium]